MDYKEKYDTALGIAKMWHKNTAVPKECKVIFEQMFPELKESYGEKIRKELIEHIKANYEADYVLFKKFPPDDVIAWLEKQGEQKPMDKVVPKFKIKDWIANGGANPCYVKSIFGNYYELCSCEGYEYTKPIIDVNYTYHLWTIKDANDGDVLCCESGWTCIFKALNGDISFSSYCFMDATGWFCEERSEAHTLDKAFIKAYNGNIYPATKEQRDQLFQKMKEAGYEWDAENKRLIKI